MPIYEYQCQACGHRLESLQKISEDPLKDCPACGKPALNRLVSAAGFRLKGGGWYETDFKSGNKRNVAESSSSANAASASGSASSSSDSGSSTSSSTTSASSD
ncbi:FmdB family zinc ribbon protein [Candidatus Macondimonas diazotrophica]|jgi:putative FmdB family regulatory protein|uniref:Zinc ribbon domain-containing protein n=1 Tax=Candidatus Macondimonas diazotrophica TaxID=2305248 RepID=A0A4Z0F709_9GAMM|nr:zinc ribbon domain-containing protein [Candidatus Macondimonas diazotrophica]MDY6957351.1 zinc ribbon domain-containing protein [Pseudomonadota bacterium]NCU02302.1 zinc ribbon domain-containing protein [Candidatus Macondimonas diazotrophica]TFZ82069.1 zinc ribbon domain-containing protein [Candidatus Macondimonas diazotrophica]